jgi:hypothetical protein
MRRLRSFPFLLVGAGSFLLFGLLLLVELPADSPLFRVLALVWQTLGAGPHLVANLLARHLPDIPGWLDVTLIVGLGLAPYLAVDLLLAALSKRWRRSADTG